MCIYDSWRQALIICSTLWRLGPVPWWITCCLVKHTLPDTCMCVCVCQVSWVINSVCRGSGQSSVWCKCIKGAEIFLRPDRRSVSRELIIGQHTAHSLHRGCRGAQAAKSSPYCAYSPHLRSLCCAVHSGPPVQLFLYKKLQNSILQRENRDKKWAGERRQKQH